MLSPETLAAPGTEHSHQTAYFCALATLGPTVAWVHAIPNGGARDSITSGKLKAEGVKAGVWDVFVPVARPPWCGMYIEFKKPSRRKEKNGGLTEAQKAFGLAMHAAGFHTAVCYTWKEALDATLAYLALASAGAG